MSGRGDDRDAPDAATEFERFMVRHTRELGRLAFLLLGDPDAADDLTADVFLAVWRQWDAVRAADHPIGYVRRIMANLAATRIRSATRERRRVLLFHGDATETVSGPDSAAVVDVREALSRLPAGRRACLVLRYALDLPEREVAETLGISVGTVKSQTAKAVEQFRRLLGDGPDGWAAGFRLKESGSVGGTGPAGRGRRADEGGQVSPDGAGR